MQNYTFFGLGHDGPIATPEQARAWVDQVARDGANGVKILGIPPDIMDATIDEAALVMAEKTIGCLPVVEGGRLVGMVTETDVLRCVAGIEPDQG